MPGPYHAMCIHVLDIDIICIVLLTICMPECKNYYYIYIYAQIMKSNEDEIKALFSILLGKIQKEFESQKLDVSDVRRFLVNFFQKAASVLVHHQD